MTYEVYALKYAHHARRKAENFIGGDPHDGPMPLDYFVWLIRGHGREIVVDTGPGVPEADRSRVVERFVRLEGSRNEPGVGLGLSLAPIGAYLVVTGEFALLPVLFSLAVITWVSGFDIIYAPKRSNKPVQADLRSAAV